LHFDGRYSAIGSLTNTEYRYYAKTYSCSSNSSAPVPGKVSNSVPTSYDSVPIEGLRN
jgi:hypothetical protein